MNTSIVAFAVIAAIAGGWVTYSRKQTAEQEVSELKKSRTAHDGRSEAASARLAGLKKQIAAKEAEIRELANTPQGPNLVDLRREADKVRAQWKELHWSFQQRLQTARQAVVAKEIPEITAAAGSWKKAKITAIDEAGIRFEHSGGITKVAAADLKGKLAEYLLLGWRAKLPDELESPGALDGDLPPLPASAPLATLNRAERDARVSLVKVRMADLEDRLARAQEESEKQKDIQRLEESRVEAAVVTKTTLPRDAKTRADAARKRVVYLQTRIVKDQREHLGLKRELQQIEAFEAKQGG